MKYIIQILAAFSMVVIMMSCEDDKADGSFALGVESISIGAEGGTQSVKVRSAGKWSASTEYPWINVSPANGIGEVDCQIKIDSTLLADEERQGAIRFVAEGQGEALMLNITQNGFEKIIQLSTTDVEIPTFGELEKRNFEVELTANVEFDIKIPEEVEDWLKVEDYKFELDRGSRPRTVKLKFTWENNSRPSVRKAEIQFKPKKEETISKHDKLTITQEKAALIVPGIEGDSLAIIGCIRSLGSRMGSNEGERMANWDFVRLWYASDEGVKPEDIGRVRSVVFRSFIGKEGIPYEIQFLTSAENIEFHSGVNIFRNNFSTGEDISKLTQLKRLTIYSFGISEVHPSLVNLKNLEYLDLSGNNLNKVPEILTPENFPNLVHLDLVGNDRWDFSDMRKPPYYVVEFGGQDTWGGLLGKFPTHLLSWEKLEYLGLGNNLIYGTIPTEEDLADFPMYTQEDLKRDTLPNILLNAPKVLPNAKVFKINRNLMEGEIPDWILYHPKLISWNPFTFVYIQNEDKIDFQGKIPGFSNLPLDWNYYWEKYPHKKF